MPRFLSPEWVEAVNRALAGPEAEEATSGPSMTVRHLVTGAPDGEVEYRLSVSPAGGQATLGPAGRADVTFSSDYATAAAISRGDLTAQRALADGHLRLSGDITALSRLAAALATLEPALAPVRAETTY
jgi:hypothetical protein